MVKKITRRDFVVAGGLLTAGAALAACQPKVVEKIVKETVVVEKEKQVEKIVQQTVVVQKEVQKEVTKVVEKSTGIKNVPRERTLIFYFGGSGGTWTNAGLASPYCTGYTHQNGDAAVVEPLEYYSAFADKFYPWTAESHEYNKDLTELTIKIRKGVQWSDGSAFTAKDVAFTLNMLIKFAPQLGNSSYVKTWVKSATAADDFTCKIVFNNPNPRFYFDFLTFKFDTGIKIIPEAIFKTVDDPTKFTWFDPDKNYPLSTGAYKYTYFTNMQKFLDRRDDWWAAKTGFAKLPEVERILCLPMVDDTKAAQLSIQNAVDACLDIRPNVIKTIVEQNPNVITHSLKKKPYGYIDWWPNNIAFGGQSQPPFNTPDLRWAVSYAIDRKQAIDVAYDGAGSMNALFLPAYKSLQPFLDGVADLLKQYPTNEFNLAKSDELMKKNGWAKDAKGLWAKGGQNIKMEMGGWQIYADIGPIVAEQLRKAGFDASYSQPADWSDRFAKGQVNGGWNGHGGSVGPDPYLSAMEYHKMYSAPIGTPAARVWHWENDQYSALIDEMGKVPMGDPKVMELWKQAIAIWLKELPSAPMIQWYHRIPMNLTYWTGWPTEEDPYVNGAPWHLTFPIVLMHLKAVKK